MADVFISYKRDERERVVPLAERLRELRVDVWFDADLHTGKDFTDAIVDELKIAKAIIVCWSTAAGNSKWVRSEARVGLDQETIVPCFIEHCSLWPPFNNLHVEDLADWHGEFDHPGFLKVAQRIGELVKRPGLQTLCLARTDPTGGKLALWASTFPDDPAVESVWPIWESKQRDDFARELEHVRLALEKRSKRRQARVRSKLAALEREFDAWLSRRAGVVDHRRPDPRALLVSDEGADAVDVPAMIADARASDDGIDPPTVVGSAPPADEPQGKALVPVTSTPPPSRRFLLVAASLVLGLILGGGSGWLTAKPSASGKNQEVEQVEAEIRDRTAQSASEKKALEAELQQSTTEGAAAASARRVAEADLAGVKTALGKAQADAVAANSRAAELSSSLDQVNAKLAALASADTARQAAEAELAKVKAAVGKAQEAATAAKSRAGELSAQLDQVNVKLTTLASADTARQAAEAELAKVKAAVIKAQEEATAAQSKASELSSQLDQVNAKLATLESADTARQAAEAELARVKAQADERLEASQADVAKAQGEMSEATSHARELASDLAKANAKIAKLEAVRQRAPDRPTEVDRSDAEQRCTESAGGPLDPDNRDRLGSSDISKIELSSIQTAISACRTAARGRSDVTIRRQMLAQLGRAEAASAVIEKRDNDDDSGAQADMKLAKENLEKASGLGSSYATSLLGYLYDGKFDRDAKTKDFFIQQDRQKASQLYATAAQRGNPAAMTYLAQMILDSDGPLEFDAAKAFDWLRKAEALGDPRAAFALAQAILDDRVSQGMSTIQRRRKAAVILAEATCHGISASDVDGFFEKSNLLKSYRPTSISCP